MTDSSLPLPTDVKFIVLNYIFGSKEVLFQLDQELLHWDKFKRRHGLRSTAPMYIFNVVANDYQAHFDLELYHMADDSFLDMYAPNFLPLVSTKSMWDAFHERYPDIKEQGQVYEAALGMLAENLIRQDNVSLFKVVLDYILDAGIDFDGGIVSLLERSIIRSASQCMTCLLDSNSITHD